MIQSVRSESALLGNLKLHVQSKNGETEILNTIKKNLEMIWKYAQWTFYWVHLASTSRDPQMPSELLFDPLNGAGTFPQRFWSVLT